MEQFVWSMASTGAFGSYSDAFKGTNVVILGGTGNVGAGVALAFAREGATVYITGRTQEKIDAVRAQWQWPDSVVGIVGDCSTDEQAAATVERVWSAASGSVLHCVNSIGFGEFGTPYSETSTATALDFLQKHNCPRLRAQAEVAKRLLHVPGATLTNISGMLAHGVHKVDGTSGLWLAGLGGAVYIQASYAVASEVRDKKGTLRAATAVVYMGVSKPGESAQQFGMPADPDSSVHLGRGLVGIALDKGAPNGKSYEFADWDAIQAEVGAVYDTRQDHVHIVPDHEEEDDDARQVNKRVSMSKSPDHVEGWLTKQPEHKNMFSSAKKRWFVFQSGQMTYWVRQDQMKKGEFSTKGMTIAKKDRAARCFSLQQSKSARSWELTADSEDDFDLWVSVLEQHGGLSSA